MKKWILGTFCLFLTLTLLGGCKNKKVAKIEVTNYQNVVLKGTDLTGLKVNTVLENGTKGEITDVKANMISGYDKTKTGSQTVKITYEEKEFTYTVYVADKIVKNATELRAALKSQKAGEVIALKEGTYDMDRDNETMYEGQSGFYFLLTADSVTLKGFGNVVVKSSVVSENGSWASQNFVTIAGDSTTIENITFQCKNEPNKVIEILGKNTTLRKIKVVPMGDTKFAGSIYLSTKEGNTTIENCTLKYGRITTSGAAGSTLTIKNTTIDFANAYLDDGAKESTYWGFDNSRSKITVNATASKIIVSKTFKDDANYQSFTAQLPTGFTVEVK